MSISTVATAHVPLSAALIVHFRQHLGSWRHRFHCRMARQEREHNYIDVASERDRHAPQTVGRDAHSELVAQVCEETGTACAK